MLRRSFLSRGALLCPNFSENLHLSRPHQGSWLRGRSEWGREGTTGGQPPERVCTWAEPGRRAAATQLGAQSPWSPSTTVPPTGCRARRMPRVSADGRALRLMPSAPRKHRVHVVDQLPRRASPALTLPGKAMAPTPLSPLLRVMLHRGLW